MATVTMKPKPDPRATSLRYFFSISNRREMSGKEYRSSDVVRSIMVVEASHNETSETVRGKIMRSDPFRSDTAFVSSSRLE